MCRREAEDQIIQICKRLLFFILLSINLIYCCSTNLYAEKRILEGNQKLEFVENFSGNYLSWVFSEKYGDVKSSNIFLTKLSDNLKTNDLIIKAFNSSLLINDWSASKKLAKKIVLFDKHNFFANLVLSVDHFNNKNYNNSLVFVENIKKAEIDKNFLDIIHAWISFAEDNDVNPSQVLGDHEKCIPVKCLHLGLMSELQNKKQISRKIYEKMLNDYESSIRLYEIFLAFFNKTNDKKKINLVFEKLSFIDNNLINEINLNDNVVKKINGVSDSKDALAEIYFNISGWFYEKKLYKFSVYFGNIGLNLKQDFPALRSLLANSYKKINLFEYALKNLEKIKEDSLYYNAVILTQVEILDEIGKTENIINLLKDASKKTKSNNINMLLADSLRSSGLYQESIKIYDSLIKKINKPQQRDWGLFYSRGIAYERIKKWKKAERDFLMALELMPNEPYVLNYLGYSWLERKENLSEALELILIAAQQKPHDAYIIDSLGWAYYLLGEFSNSIQILERAVSLSPNDATLNDHLGDAYWKVGRTREAISQWKRVLIFDPKFKRKDEIQRKIVSGI